MSRMNGGEFFKFILDCWHCFTTLSISFHVFSKVRLSITNFGGAMTSERAPCNREIRVEIFFGCPFRAFPLVAILMIAQTRAANPTDLTLALWMNSFPLSPSWCSSLIRLHFLYILLFVQRPLKISTVCPFFHFRFTINHTSKQIHPTPIHSLWMNTRKHVLVFIMFHVTGFFLET